MNWWMEHTASRAACGSSTQTEILRRQGAHAQVQGKRSKYIRATRGVRPQDANEFTERDTQQAQMEIPMNLITSSGGDARAAPKHAERVRGGSQRLEHRQAKAYLAASHHIADN